MKRTLPLLLLFPIHSFSQNITNGSFENAGAADLSGWSYQCDAPQSTSDAAPNAGSWAARVQSGNTQGCAIGYLYQLFPNIQDGDVFTLSGWAKVDPNWVNTNVGLFLGKKQPGNNFFLDNGSLTNSTTWTYLNITDTFHLDAGDTAAVVLNAGLVGGPSIAWAQFDGIQFGPSISTGIRMVQEVQLSHYPDPVADALFIVLNRERMTKVEIFDLTGKSIQNLRTTVVRDRLVVDTSTLTSGIHIARIITDAGPAAVRFTKR